MPKESQDKITGLGLTYDDVLLIPGASGVLPREVDVSTRLTRGIELNIPVISAAMDTVTESDMAIAMARQGGIGILHKNLSVEAQSAMVEKVKRSESGMIAEPLTLSPENTVRDANDIMRRHGVSGIPIVGKGQKLLGIVTNRDLRFEVQNDTPLKEVMTKDDLVTAPLGTSLEEAQEILQKHKIEKLLIVDKAMILKGLITFKDIEKKKSFPNAAKDGQGRLLVGAAVGVSDQTLEYVEALVSAEVDVVVVDSAHGHAQKVLQRVKDIKDAFPDLQVVTGNIVTAEAAEDSIKAGADAVKVGVGPGSICFEAGTLITMEDHSAKPIEQVGLGEYVITHKNRKRMVTKKYVREHKGQVCEVNIKGSPGVLKMTPNHPVLAVTFDFDEKKLSKCGAKYCFDKKKHNKGLRWTEAGKLKKNDVVAVPRAAAGSVEPERIFDLSHFVPGILFDGDKIWSEKIGFNPNEESHVDLASRFGTTPRVVHNIVHGGRSMDMELNTKVNGHLEMVGYQRRVEPNKVNRFIKLDNDLMKLFGYFVAEGYVAGAKNNRQLCFAFASYEKAHHEEVGALIEKVFGYYSSKIIYHKQRSSAVVHVFSHAIATFFESIFPLGAKNKRVPGFVLEQDTSLLRDFVRSAWNGDGTISELARASYKTTSPSLAFQMAEALIRMGFMPSVRSEQPRNPNWNIQYKVSVSGDQHREFMKLVFPDIEAGEKTKSRQQIWADEDYIYLTIKEVNTVNKETTVYNLEVDEDNSYLANRIAVHNCTTRIVAGVGVPQLTAIMNCAAVAAKHDVPLIADGGIKYTGDVPKAIAAGADTVMLGSMLAGTEEAPGKTVLLGGRKYKTYRGMGSQGAMIEGTRDRYFQDMEDNLTKLVPEGIEGRVPFRGYLRETTHQIVGGLRAAMGYCGAKDIATMKTKTRFTRITHAGIIESHPHDVEITEQAPNYWK